MGQNQKVQIEKKNIETQYSGLGQGGLNSNKAERNLIYWVDNGDNITYAAGGAAWALYKCMVWWLASPDCIERYTK